MSQTPTLPVPDWPDRAAWQRRPDRQPNMFQRWQHLLFLHWACDPQRIQSTLPAGLRVDTFEGQAYLGVVPFQMRGIRPAWAPSVPWVSNFLELNLRTYVLDEQGRPGVWFYSLNADRWLACTVARSWFHLPYHWSRMRCEISPEGWLDYYFQRRGTSADLACHFRYRGVGTAVPAQRGSLEFFLVERYLLFTLRRGELCCGQVHHTPYPVQSAEVSRCENFLCELDGLPPVVGPPEHVAYASGVDVDVFSLRPLIPRSTC
ncbi:MAG: DUF2071 domain-containing protein [Planctomycetaceae bacterium]|nr:DUF2071 domain-containing protein [Planctomycetaceae bacterium]